MKVTDKNGKTVLELEPGDACLVVTADGKLHLSMPQVNADNMTREHGVLSAVAFRWDDPDWRKQMLEWLTALNKN